MNGLNIVVQILYHNFKRIKPNKRVDLKSKLPDLLKSCMKNLRSKFLVRAGDMFPGTGTLGRKDGVGVCYVQLYEPDSGLCTATAVIISTLLQREDPS